MIRYQERDVILKKALWRFFVIHCLMDSNYYQTEIGTVEQLPAVASQLLATFPDERFYAFFGPMGVGKTTLIKELC